jgi:hypothetical protein
VPREDDVSWAKLDDRFYGHPKVLAAVTRDVASIALHALALSYSADYELDGRVPRQFAVQAVGERADDLAGILVDVGLWLENGEGWEIHDFLDYNPSKVELEKKRAARRRAGRKGGKASGAARRVDGSTPRERENARRRASRAIARGELVPEPCEVCGDEPTEAHHDDYAKPLEVRWLCGPHHDERHREINAERTAEQA